MEPCFYKNERQLNISRKAELVVSAVYKVFSLESTGRLDLAWKVDRCT